MEIVLKRSPTHEAHCVHAYTKNTGELSFKPGGVLHQPLANWEEATGANTAELTVEELVFEAKQALSASVVLAGDCLRGALYLMRQHGCWGC